MPSPNTISEGKLHLRCWECGDSPKNPDTSHLVVFLNTGIYYCIRCQATGHLPLGDIISLVLNSKTETEPRKRGFIPLGSTVPQQIEPVEPNTPGPLGRYSKVERRYTYHTSNGPCEIFECRELAGDVVGYHVRASWAKVTRTLGSRALGHSGVHPLDSVLRIVEGPYDVLYANDICSWGIPSVSQARMLLWRRLILCPDGDVWPDRAKRRAWFKPFLTAGSWVESVERLPDTKDPDEVPAEERESLSWAEVTKLL